ncbi:hypothetical protein K2173_020763 [Erythroxylum novogranatense]|uniref:Uncharacterized protein n=1 Tax=Erythroxylum novogranatense TaxID=1862640 RepID=A0AAV8TPR1_9ROSI|nr:hypothetical protein K2173_020763 [Erythroxylum novogranatense]
MASILRLRKLCYLEPLKFISFDTQEVEKKEKKGAQNALENNRKRTKRQSREWRCVDCCCWLIGYACTIWWLLLFFFHCFPATLPGFQVPESPGTRLRREGLTALHLVVLVPGIFTGGLELWQGKPYAEGLFRKRLWGGSFTEVFKRPLCWLEHMSLHNETGLDLPGIRVRVVLGLIAADYFAPGYFVWAVLIENLAKIGYEGKNMYMAAYDWRLSFQNTEGFYLSTTIGPTLMYRTNRNKKVVVVPHLMGGVYFLHFLKWVETASPVGRGGGPSWCAKHIKAIVNISPAFLGVPKAVSNLISSEAKDIASISTELGSFLRHPSAVLNMFNSSGSVMSFWFMLKFMTNYEKLELSDCSTKSMLNSWSMTNLIRPIFQFSQSSSAHENDGENADDKKQPKKLQRRGKQTPKTCIIRKHVCGSGGNNFQKDNKTCIEYKD